MEKISAEFVRERLPVRKETDNKYSVGTLLAVTGSKYMTGAAHFAALGALYSGVGLLFQASDEDALAVLQGKLSEPVFSVSDEASVKRLLAKASAILFGCGLCESSHNEALLEYILTETEVPAVIDATALTMLSHRRYLLERVRDNVILTPHEGEAERILKYFPEDRAAAVADFCSSHGCVFVLKGHETLVGQGGRILANTTGNAGMAKGGYGDVLAGMAGSFLAQGLSPIDAAACAAYVHGLAGDITAESLGMLSAIPSEAVKNIPEALKRTYKR